jgi:hypothetical protein
MKTAIALLILSIATAAQAMPPTATEVFHLRTECARLGDKLSDEMVHGTQWTRSVVTNYSEATNRCYVEMLDTNETIGETTDSLFDAQTTDLLASWKVHGKQYSGSIWKHPPNPDPCYVAIAVGDPSTKYLNCEYEQAKKFIDKMMN